MSLSRLISVAAAAAVIWLSTLVSAATAETARIAVLVSGEDVQYWETLAGFQRHLEEHGVDVTYDTYPLKGDRSKAVEALTDIRRGGVDLVYTLGSIATDAAIDNGNGLPVVAGLVLKGDSLEGSGNATGVTLEFPLQTQLDILRRILPEARAIGVIYNPAENRKYVKAARSITRSMGFTLITEKVGSARDIPSALKNIAKRVDVLLGINDGVVLTPETARQLLLFSYRNNVPLIGMSCSWVEAGALFSLERDYGDIGSQCGEMAIKVLNGTPACDVPAAAPRKLIYCLNLKTAQKMKIKISETAISGAYEVFRE